MPNPSKAVRSALLVTKRSAGGLVDQPEPFDPITAYHGSPHQFDQFDTSKIGSGEGNQSFGRGLYFAGNEDVAKTYRAAGQPIANPNPAPGHMYQVGIKANPNHFLDWDKPVHEQHPRVQSAMRSVINDLHFDSPDRVEQLPNGRWAPMKGDQVLGRKDGWPDRGTAGDIKRGIEEEANKNSKMSAGALMQRAYAGQNLEAKSMALAAHGVPGIKYLDQVSRGNGRGSHNYVVFDPKHVDIQRRYERGGLARRKKAGGGSLSDAISSFSKDREAQFNRPSSGNSDAALLASLQQHPQLAVAEPPERARQSMSQGANDLGAQIDEGARWLSGTPEEGATSAKGSAKGTPSKSGAPVAPSQSATPMDAKAKEVDAYVRQAAAARGIDPDVASSFSRAESSYGQNYVGDGGSSFGPFQLHYGGVNKEMPHPGLGDAFTKTTGLDARDPATWRQQVDFSLDQAAQGGWSPWSTMKTLGYQPRTGLDDAHPAPAPPQPQQAQAPQPAPPPPVQPQPVTPAPQAQADPLGNLYNKVANSPSVASGYGNPQAMFDPDTPQAKRGGQIRRASGGGIAVMPTNDLIQLALDRINRQRFASGGMSHSDVHRIVRQHFDGGGSGGDGGDGGGSSGDGGDGGGGDGDGGDSGDSGDSGDTGFGTSGVGTAGASVGFGSAGDSSGVGGVGDAGAPAGTSSNSGMAGFAGIGGGDSGDAGVGGPSATGSSVGFAGSPGTSSTGVGSGPGSATGVSGPGAPGAATGVGTAGVGPGTAATGNAAAASTAAGMGAHGAGSFGGAGGPGFGAFGSGMGFGLGQSGAGDTAASNSNTATLARLAATPMRYGFVQGNDPGMMAATSVQGLFGNNTSPAPSPTPAPTSPLSPSVVAQLNAQMGGASSATAAPAPAPAPAPASPSPAPPSPAAPIGFGNVGFGGSSSSPGTGVTGFNSNPAGNAASVSTASLASPATPAAPIAFADSPSPATSPASPSSPVSAVSNIGTPNSPLGLTSPTPAPTTTPSPTISPAVQMGAGSGEQNVGSFPSAAKPATAAQPASPAATPNFAPAIPSGVAGNHGGYGNVTGAAPNYNGSYNSTLDQALGTNNPTADQIFGFTYPTPPPSKAQPQGPISQAQINALSGQGSQVFASGGAIIMDAALNKARKAIKRNKRYV